MSAEVAGVDATFDSIKGGGPYGAKALGGGESGDRCTTRSRPTRGQSRHALKACPFP